MQLIIISITFFLFVVCQDLKAQIEKKTWLQKSNVGSDSKAELKTEVFEKPDWKAIDINFLSSYYSQDGNNSPVTGGIGTEQLTDFTQKIAVSIPTSPRLKLNIDGGYDYYSSASTDNIDYIPSSYSSADMRVHGNIGLGYELNDRQTLGVRVGGSSEYDYISVNGGLTYDWLSASRNTSLGLSAQAFIDKWTLYYPVELRREGRLVPTDKRQSYNASISLAQIINKKMQIAIQLEATYMNGLLSTPFHRVYFAEQDRAKVESLPQTRLKLPIGVRLNTYVTEWLISRLYYRYYNDDWGMTGHTMSIELPVKLNRFLSIYPSYRYHTQTAADYFLPYKEHVLSDQFYTSDYDLAALSSQTFGIGATISPAKGLAKMKIPFSKATSMHIDGIDIKLSHYRRSTGLNANIVSVGVKIGIR